MQEIKVSIIIPTYNRKKPLQDTVRELLKQNYQNYEIIIVSQKYKVKPFNHPKVRIFHLSKANLPNARNYGIKKSSGDIVVFLD
ncbi:MAG: glycosyltransferase family 2 protein, partial [bacterium]